MNNFTIKDLIEYRTSIEKRRINKSPDFFLNDSMICTVLVQTEMLKEAVESRKPLNIYCGRFTSFRLKAEAFIEEQKQKSKPIEGTEEYTLWENFNPYNDLLNTLKVFFDNGGSMNVILDEKLEGLANDTKLWTVINDPIARGQLNYYQLPSPSGLDHFSITGNAFRRESSADERTAICSFNHGDTTDILSRTFDFLADSSVKVNVA